MLQKLEDALRDTGDTGKRELKNTNLGGDEIDEDVTANIEMAHG